METAPRIGRHSCVWQHWHTTPARLRNELCRCWHFDIKWQPRYGLKRKTNRRLLCVLFTSHRQTTYTNSGRKSQTLWTHIANNERCLPFYKDSVCTRTIQFNIVLKLDCPNWEKKSNESVLSEIYPFYGFDGKIMRDNI